MATVGPSYAKACLVLKVRGNGEKLKFFGRAGLCKKKVLETTYLQSKNVRSISF